MSEPVHFYQCKEPFDCTPSFYVVEVTHKYGMRHMHKFLDSDEAHSFSRKLCDD